jgi:3-deoxy-manno-octulosonate cytidylyltransferase (CMP-KDO synthetase)
LAAVVLIPARFGSTRFPAKVVADRTGRPLVQHVVDRARLCKRISRIMVATDDDRIATALRPFETEVVLTSAGHQSGTDRIAEVAATLSADIVINVQGDEPEIEPELIDALVDRLEKNPQLEMATAATPFPRGADPTDPNLVKVVMTTTGRAIYFSRSVIPFNRDADGPVPAYHLHLGIYAYRRSFLLRFAGWPQTPLETTEKLEQLRAIERGVAIDVLKVDRPTHGIDTAQQYEAFVERYRKKVGS